MKFSKAFILPLAASVFAVATPAHAETLIFDFTGQTLTGPVMATFQLDSNPVPDRINDQSAFGFGQIFFNNVPGTFNGVNQTAGSISFGTGIASAFQITGSAAGFAQFGGDDVFTGAFNAPVFSPGTFTFGGFSRGTLTVSRAVAAVPEPATWAMLILGFGLIGGAMRRRRTMNVNVSYA